SLYQIDRIQVAAGAVSEGISEQVHQVLDGYGDALKALYQGYHILDRNYTYDFHNELFLRNTILVPEYRKKGLEGVDNARRIAASTNEVYARLQASTPVHGPLASMLEEIRAYVDYNLERATLLEAMSGKFEQTPAGLQHAAHLYEGENKML